MSRDCVFGIWWDGPAGTDARNGYNRPTDEDYAQFRIGRLHLWWGIGDEA